LPNIVEVAEGDWHLHGFNESTALVLKHAGTDEGAHGGGASDVYDFYVNVDNSSSELPKRSRKTIPKLLKAKFVYGQVLVGLAFLQHDRIQPAAAPDKDDDERDESNAAKTKRRQVSKVQSRTPRPP